jgi:hypothetical protein
MPHRGIRLTLALSEGFVGLCGGGIALLTGAFGFAQWLPTSVLQGTPFSDYTIPGLVLCLVLLVLIGGGMALAASTIFMRRPWAVLLSVAMGLVMVGFEAVEIAVIDRNPPAIVPQTVAQQFLFVGLGLVIVGLAVTLWFRDYSAYPRSNGSA